LPCNNGADDDGDGLTDFAEENGDPGCATPDDSSERDPAFVCDDGLDNDVDTKFDFRTDGTGDPDCESPLDPSETSAPPACSDGLDNDADGPIDFRIDDSGDPACTDRADTSE
jgi:hypothetical protein